MKFSITGAAMCSVAALAVSMGGSASAQSAQGAASPNANPPATAGGLEEIVVTSQKRAERIQDVPIAISAISAGSLTDKRIVSTEDLKYTVPTLNWSVEAGFSAPFLRGIGTDVYLPNADTDVATYVDGVFIADDTSSVANLMYVDRVEVLEGPQGTLYGRNAVAGAISIVTLTPSQDLKADAKIGFGDYAEKEASGYVSGPITDNFYAGIYGSGTIRNGYVHNVIPQNQLQFPGQPAHDNAVDVRGKFVWDLGLLTLTGTVEHVETQSSDANVFRNIQPGALGYAFGANPTIQNYVNTDRFPNFEKVKTDFGALREEAKFDWGTILGITGYHSNTTEIAASIDGTSAGLVGQLAIPQTGEQYSQELQILSPDDAKIKWIGGVYLFRASGVYVNDEVVCSIVCTPPFSDNKGTVITSSAAVFGQATAPILDNLNLTLGGRYTFDYKDFSGSQYNQGAAFGDILSQSTYPNQHKHWEQFNPKITLDYKVDDTLFYATYSTGFKSGVFNQAAPSDPGPVNPEKLTDYEIGSKSVLFNGTLRLNTSAYYYQFSNIQVQVNNGGTNGNGGSAILQNAASAEAYGLEFSGEVLVTSALKLTGSAAWEHSDYTSFKGAVSYAPAAVGNQQIFVDATNNPLQRAPEWTATLGVQYSLDLPYDFTSNINLNWYYNGGFNWEPTGVLKEPSYNTLGTSISVISPDQQWTGTFWMKNITNEYYRETALITGFGTLVADAPPRMFGFTLDYHFTAPASEPEETAAAYVPPPVVAPVAAPKSYLVFFDFNKSDLSSEAASIVDQAAKNAGLAKVTRLEVTGHTDTVGSDAYNMRLSRRRAESVAAELEVKGIPSSEIAIFAKGKRDLLVPTGDGVKEPQNRRVQIVYADGATS
jgi:iron complex outermembrane receptor protein